MCFEVVKSMKKLNDKDMLISIIVNAKSKDLVLRWQHL